ncbi:MAG: PfkB family carbohydrate kinase, partial [Victivallaceae bacterium]
CAVCGSPPDGKSEQLYFAAAAAYRQDRLFFVDYYKNLHKIYAANPRTILKINQAELTSATGEADIIGALQILRRKFGSTISIITAGAEQVYLQDHDRIYCAAVPAISTVINPIGCGDAFGGVFLAKYLQCGDLLTAFRYGIAAGSANCMTPLCGFFRLSDLH